MSTILGPRRSFAFLSTCVLTGLLFASVGCGDDVECVLDTDCELGNRCEAQMCVPFSTPPRRDTGPEQDGGEEDVGIADASMPDAGPMEDTGPDADSGPDTGPPVICLNDGSYMATPAVANPTFCNTVGITGCTVLTEDEVTTFTCGDVTGTCTYDADCVCSGTATFMAEEVTVAVDVPSLTLAVTAGAAGTCDYTLVSIAES
ncbi:MAG: hypothetical protein AB8H86_07190 [Polyangiales bacterium]